MNKRNKSARGVLNFGSPFFYKKSYLIITADNICFTFETFVFQSFLFVLMKFLRVFGSSLKQSEKTFIIDSVIQSVYSETWGVSSQVIRE